MKEFIEKLIGRLEEERDSTYFVETANPQNQHWHGVRERDLFDEIIAIVNELAEEHNDDWIPVSERLPEDDRKSYIVQKTNGTIDILRFTKDAYKLSRYDFYEYKDKKKSLFFDYDSEYGYCEWECEAWQPLPKQYKKGE